MLIYADTSSNCRGQDTQEETAGCISSNVTMTTVHIIIHMICYVNMPVTTQLLFVRHNCSDKRRGMVYPLGCASVRSSAYSVWVCEVTVQLHCNY